MTDDVRTLILEAVRTTAPDVDTTTVDTGAPLRRELDIDSLDFLVLVENVKRLTGVDIPEDDYGAVPTLDALVQYVEERRGTVPA